MMNETSRSFENLPVKLQPGSGEPEIDVEYLPPTFEIGSDQYKIPMDVVRDPYLYYDYVSKVMEKKAQDMFTQYSRESFISPCRKKL